MPLKQNLLFLTVILASSMAFAVDGSVSKYDLRSEYFKGNINFGIESAQLKTSESNLAGFGPRVGMDYDLGHGFSVNPNLVLASDGPTFIYSGLNGYIRYTVLGRLTEVHQVLTHEGVPIVEQTVPRSDRLSVGVGLEQLFLNGSQSVYPAAGVSTAVSYSFSLFGSGLELSGRYSLLSENSKSLTGLYLGLSILFGL